MNKFHIFRKLRQISPKIRQLKFYLKYRHISAFSGICREIPTKFHQHFAEKMQNSTQKIGKNSIHFFIREKMLTIFDWNFEVWAVQKYANLVDRVKSFPTSIYLQKSASIQPRTSLSKLHVSKFTCNTCKEMKITCNPPTKLLSLREQILAQKKQRLHRDSRFSLEFVMPGWTSLQGRAPHALSAEPQSWASNRTSPARRSRNPLTTSLKPSM